MRALAFLLLLPLLAGCSNGDWDYVTSFGASKPEAPETVADATPARPAPQLASGTQAAPAAPNAFCLAVARQDAMENGFDVATQQRVAVRNYQQCVEIFGNTVQ